MTKMFSIIICTYNRAKILEICLNSVANLAKNDNFDYEVLIIDNNSTDDTKKTTEDLISTFPDDRQSGWAYHLETKQGLSHARNRGIAESRGDWLIFLDDECDVRADWLMRLQRIMDRENPVMLGGPYRGKFLPGVDRSRYAKGYLERYGDSYHLRDAWQERWLSKPGLSGGNMAIRRDLLEELGSFDPAFGMSGGKLRYGEETDLQLRILARHPVHSIYYSPDLELIHYIRPEKTGLRPSFESCVQRARNVATLQSSSRSRQNLSWLELLSQIWILIRRTAGLLAFLCVQYIQTLITRDNVVRPVYEAIHSGKLQAFLQIAITVGSATIFNRR